MKSWLYFLTLFSAHFLSGIDRTYSWSNTMSNVYNTIKKDSYFPAKINPAMIKALDAFAREADEHASFLGPDEYKKLLNTTSGNFFGIGVELSPKKDEDDYITIMNVKPNSPAAKEGVQRYDKVVAIDSIPVSTLSTPECIAKLKGEKRYATVTLDILRTGKGTLKFTITRDAIPEEHGWCLYIPQQKIVYCALTLFTNQTANQLEAALTKGLLKKPRGIILDLRDNAGGVLQAAVDCASLFLPHHTLIVSTKDRNNRTLEQYYTHKQPIVPANIPIIILVNKFTASSAEILAEALKIYSKTSRGLTSDGLSDGNKAQSPRHKQNARWPIPHRQATHQMAGDISPHVFLLGTPTFGKGSIQEVKPVGNNCALKITTALYYLADDTCIQEKGIMPDFLIKQKYPRPTEIKLAEKLQPSENKQKKAPTKRKRKNEDVTSQRIQALKKDYQVQCACNVIGLLDLAGSLAPLEIATHDKALKWSSEHFACQSSMSAQSLY